MPKAKGSLKTGGRQKGTPNKRTAAQVAAAAHGGITPLAHLLRVMRNPKADKEERLKAAMAAAPYVHHRLATVEHTGGGGGPVDMHWTVTFVRPPANR